MAVVAAFLMKKRPLVVLVLVAALATRRSCHAFAPSSSSHATLSQPSLLFGPPYCQARMPSKLQASVADYSGAAQALFGNIISPAALLAGGLVPLGFLADPLPAEQDSTRKRLRSVYWLLAVLSLANELTAIVYATVASNKLVEIASAPATSVFALIQRDYELSWIATNVHFLLGLFGFLSMIGLRAYTIFPCTINRAAAGLCLSALLAMCSVVNRGVSAGDGTGHLRHGSSIVTLVWRYLVLLRKQVYSKGGIMALLAMATGAISIVMAIRAVVVCQADDD